MQFGNSVECTKSELDIFYVPPTQTQIEEGIWDTIQPHPNYSYSTIQFDIPGTSSTYINMSETELYITARILKENDITIGETDKIGPAANFFHSLFNQCQVYLNNTAVENSNNTYAYRAYFENLLNNGREAKNTFLQMEVFYQDDAGTHEIFDLATTTDVPVVNSNYLKRRKRFLGGNVQMKGKIHSDIFNINKLLLNNVNITIKLSRSNDSFCLNGSSNDVYKVKIDEAQLKVRRQNISPTTMLAHTMSLEKATAKYPVKRVIVKPFTLPIQTNKTTITGIHNGIVPRRVVLGIVDTEAYAGKKNKNPFNFQHYKLSNLILKIASRSIPYSSGLSFNFPAKNYVEGYNTLFQGIREAPNNIDYEAYGNGNTIFAFDLTPDQCSGDHFSLLRDGSVDLDITFSDAPNTSITLLVYLEFDNIIEINKNRQVFFDYKV